MVAILFLPRLLRRFNIYVSIKTLAATGFCCFSTLLLIPLVVNLSPCTPMKQVALTLLLLSIAGVVSPHYVFAIGTSRGISYNIEMH